MHSSQSTSVTLISHVSASGHASSLFMYCKRQMGNPTVLFFHLGYGPTNYPLSSHLCSQLALPLSFNFTHHQNTEASVFKECLARLMLQPDYNP